MATDEAGAAASAVEERRVKIEALLRRSEQAGAWAEMLARYEIALDDILSIHLLVADGGSLPRLKDSRGERARSFSPPEPSMQRSLAELLRQTATEFDESAAATERWQVADAAVRLTRPPSR